MMDMLVDANVVLRIVDKSSLQHPIAVKAVRDLAERFRLVIVPQVAYEFWAVATRTVAANGLGMSVEQADRSLQEVVDAFPLLRDERGIIQN